jgi:peptidyl-prolyl cis-trans isomerase A (cyclophilin A)
MQRFIGNTHSIKSGLMKLILTVLLSGAALLAQAPAPAKSAPKAPAAAAKGGPAAKAGTKTGTKTAARTAPELYKVKFATTKGDFTIEVHRDWAPIGADHFYALVRSGFFNGASFFRVVPNFVVQFGMPAVPAKAAAWEKPIKDDPVKQKNTKGMVVYAATGAPNSRTTQVFVNLKDNSASLDSIGFAPFGQVTEGMEIVEQLYSGYGDDPSMGGHGPSQDRIAKEGKAYLDKSFPKLDSIKTATVTFPESAAPAAKKAAPAAKTGAPPAKSAAPAPPAKK